MLDEKNLEMLLFRSRYLKQKNYWTRKLSGQVETTDILKDLKKYRGDTVETGDTPAPVNREHYEISFYDELSRRILNICKHSELSLYIILLSTLKTLIHRYTNHKDIITLSPIQGEKATAETINSLVLIRQYVDGTMTFKEVVLNVRNAVLEAYENQDYPYEKLEEYLFPSSIPSHISCWLENIHRQADIEKIKARLSFGFSREGEKIAGRVLYDRNFYRESEIHRLANHFLLLLTRASENINARIFHIEFLTEEEKKQLLQDFNNNKVDFSRDKTLVQQIEGQMEKTPDSTAIACEHRQITYYELNQRANRLANRLKTYNLRKEQTLGILLQRSLAMVESILAAWKAGGAYIPLDTYDPAQRLQGILADSASPVLLSQAQWLAPQLEKTFNGNIMLLDEQPDEAQPDKGNMVDLNLNIEPGSLAYVIYTSGSTGKPKGAMVQHIGMMNHIRAKIHDLEITPKSIVAQNASHTFDISVWQFFTALTNGGKTVIYPDEMVLEPYRFVSRLIEDQVTILEVVPSYLSVMLEFLDASFLRFDFLRYLLVTGETIKPGLVNQWFDKYPCVKMVNAYGPTEASDDITHFIMDKAPDMERIPIGKPVRNLNIYILDEYLHLCPLGVMGEICVSGIGVGRGYMNNPELTNSRFLATKNMSHKFDRFYMSYIYKTGDLGRWLPGGAIEFFGRKDYQVKIRGFRIELGEIESRLSMHPGIKEAAVIVKTVVNPYLCAYLVPLSGGKLAIPAIKQYLAKHLPDHMVPDNFVELEHMPLTSNGKIDRKALSLLDDSTSAKKEYVPPRGRLEKKMVQVWSEVLGIEAPVIGIDANFFELGGNSLRATVLIAKLNKALEVKIPLVQLFENSTIRGLAGYVGGLKQYSFFSIDTVEEKEYYPQSSTQRRLYAIQQIEWESSAYNVMHAVVLAGELDKNRLEGMFRELIQRHESLRTSFHIIYGEPVQRIHEKVEFKIEYYDLQVTGAGDRCRWEEEGTGGLAPLSVEPAAAFSSNPQPTAALISSFIRPFDLSQAPLLWVGLITLHAPPLGHPSQEENVEDKHILMIDMHHIITDGVSMDLFVRETMALYSGAKLPPLRLQYRDYSEWQTGDRQKKAIKEQGEYWLSQFADEASALDMPFDYPRPALQSFEGAELFFEVSAELTRSSNRLALDTGATLFMVLLAIYNILLSKLSGQEDIVVGTPIAARRHSDLGRIIGMFVNTLAIRNYPAGSKTFKEFLYEVKKRILIAFENQDYPFDDLVEKVTIRREASRNPLFDTLLVINNQEGEASGTPITSVPGLNISSYDQYENLTAKFDMTLFCREVNGKLSCSFEYCTKLFKKETIKKFIIYFKKILSAVLENGSQRIAEIEIITAEEKQQILYDFNNTATAFPGAKTLQRLFVEQVQEAPDHIALVGPKEEAKKHEKPSRPINTFAASHLSYRELDERSGKLAELLIEKDVKSDTIVGIMVERSLGMIIGILGILKAGGAYMPIDPDYPEERVKYMLADSSARFLVTTPGLSEKFKKLSIVNCQLLIVNEMPPNRLGVNNERLKINNLQLKESNLAYVLYTSGSTGNPKGVMLQHSSLVNLLLWGFKFTGLDFSSVLQFATLSFDASFHEIFSTLLCGGKLTLIPEELRTDIPGLFSLIERNEIKTVFLPISFLKIIFNEPVYAGSFPACIRHIQTAGDLVIISEGFSAYLKMNKVHLHNHYGPTEAHVVTAYTVNPAGEIPRFPPIGKPVSNTLIYMMDKYMNLQPVGVAGELYIGGIQVGRGYLNKPELTSERFGRTVISHSSLVIGSSKSFPNDQCPMSNDLFYRTGDLARWLADSNIEFLGRIDHQVKIRGFRVELGEIENRLLNHPGIKEAVAAVGVDKTGDKYICAYIVSQREFSVSQLRGFLSGKLPDYMIPAYFVPLEKIPLTTSGKVDRKALPEPGTGIGTDMYVPPRDDIEEQLVRIWCEVLAIEKEKISTNANFFALGGHSLRATVMLAKIHKQLNVELPLAQVFKSPTIKGLSSYIKELVPSKYVSLKPTEKREYYPLSSAQRRLYVLKDLDEQVISYNLPSILILEGDVKKSIFEETFLGLIERHESLRTSFHMIADEPVQRIHAVDDVEFEIEYYDLQVTGAGDKCRWENEGTRGLAPLPIEPASALISSFIRPFDLSKAPLFRVELIKLPHTPAALGSHPSDTLPTPSALRSHPSQEGKEDRYFLMVDMHHIISDGVSMSLLIREFMQFYDGESLPHIKGHYKDFSEWQNSKEWRESIKQQKKYWLREFEGEIPVLDLPGDFPRPVLQGFEGRVLNFEMDKETILGLKAHALKEGTTFFMVLLTAYNVFLQKLSNQEDIVVGTPSAGRSHADLEHIAGMFVNTLVLRNFPRGEKSFNEFLNEVKTRTLEAFENQDYPYEALVESVVAARDTGRNPLFDTMFILQNLDIPKIEIPGLTLKPHNYDSVISRFDLTLQCLEADEKLLCSFEFSTKIFKTETIVRLINYFRKTISLIIESPQIKISDMEIISEEEKTRLLFDFNDTRANYPKEKALQQLFEEQVDKTPGNIAIVFETHHLSYQALNQRANQLACTLRQKGTSADIMIGIMVKRSPDMLIGIMAVLKAGGAYLPIDPDYPRERKLYILKDSNVRLLLVKEKSETNLGDSKELIDLDNSAFYQGAGKNSEKINKSNDLVYVIYTSGSTGRPKGVMIRHYSLINRLNWMQKKYQMEQQDIILHKTPFTFDVSLWEIFWWSTAGARVCLLIPGGEKEPQIIINAIQRYGVTIMHFVPSMLKVFLEFVMDNGKANDIISLKQIIASGEALTVSMVELFNDTINKCNATRLANLYGPTEATVDVSYFDCPGEGTLERVPIGKPIDNIKLFVLDSYLKVQPVGIGGELYISGDGLARGYLNRPELTAEKFDHDLWDYQDYHDENQKLLRGGQGGSFFEKIPPGRRRHLTAWGPYKRIFKTGDLARWLPDGNIEFLGRIDHQVKIRGLRIELGEIESQLLKYEEINEAVVVVKVDTTGDKHLCAYIVPDKEFSVSQLRGFLSGKLPDYMIPAYFVFLERIPLTLNGKVDRKSLPKPGMDIGQSYIAPGNKIEKKLVAIWSELLSLEKEKISIDANFFALGGHSLKAAVMTAKIHKELHVKLPMTEIFKNPNIKSLSRYIKEQKKEEYIAIEAIEKKEYYFLSPAQKRLYILQQMDLHGTVYNMPQFIFITNEIQGEKLQGIFKRLIKRHESLRTSFHMIDKEPMQRIQDHVGFKIDHKKVEVKQLSAALISSFIRPFDLSLAPLLRVGLIPLHAPPFGRRHFSQEEKVEGKHILMIDMHHIISDGISHEILEAEFMQLYKGQELPGLRLQYKGFSQWRNHQADSGYMKNQESYWLKQFTGSIPTLNLPTDYPRGEVKDFKGSTINFEISAEAAVQIRKISTDEGNTSFITIFAVFNVFLAKLSGQEDIIVGTPVAGRNHADLQSIIGMFVNTLAIRNYPWQEKTFLQFLREVKNRVLEAFENQDYPLEELVEKVVKKREPGRSPLFDVMFQLRTLDPGYDGEPEQEISAGKPIVSEDEPDELININRTSKYDLTFDGMEVGKKLSFSVEYSARLFKKETIEVYVDYFQQILLEVLKKPDIPLKEIKQSHEFPGRPLDNPEITFDF